MCGIHGSRKGWVILFSKLLWMFRPPQMDYPNCAVMIEDKFHASWMVSGSRIQVQLSGRVDKGQYLAFGVSGSTTRTLMDGSDVAVVWEKEDGTIGVVDYNLQSKQQVS